MDVPLRAHTLPRRRGAIIVGAVAGAAIVVAAVGIPLAANAEVDLPDKTPAELLAFAQASDVDALSGTLEQSSELGLPDLGGIGEEEGSGDDSGPGFADALDLVTGTHTANVFLDGDRSRLQVLDDLAERDVYLDGDAGTAWFVDSESQTATRVTVTGDRESGDHETVPATPEGMLDDALARLDESTEVTVGTDRLVAGREVYELVLSPRTDDTLVGEVRVAIDGENGVALAASVSARGASAPAFQAAFTEVSFDAPDPADLEFTPSDTVEVIEREVPLPSDAQVDEWLQHATGSEVQAPVVHGEGWSAVVELSSGDAVIPWTSGEAQQFLTQATQAVDGGRLLETALVSVLLADDGRVLVGAVPGERLVEVAAGLG